MNGVSKSNLILPFLLLLLVTAHILIIDRQLAHSLIPNSDIRLRTAFNTHKHTQPIEFHANLTFLSLEKATIESVTLNISGKQSFKADLPLYSGEFDVSGQEGVLGILLGSVNLSEVSQLMPRMYKSADAGGVISIDARWTPDPENPADGDYTAQLIVSVKEATEALTSNQANFAILPAATAKPITPTATATATPKPTTTPTPTPAPTRTPPLHSTSTPLPVPIVALAAQFTPTLTPTPDSTHTSTPTSSPTPSATPAATRNIAATESPPLQATPTQPISARLPSQPSLANPNQPTQTTAPASVPSPVLASDTSLPTPVRLQFPLLTNAEPLSEQNPPPAAMRIFPANPSKSLVLITDAHTYPSPVSTPRLANVTYDTGSAPLLAFIALTAITALIVLVPLFAARRQRAKQDQQ